MQQLKFQKVDMHLLRADHIEKLLAEGWEIIPPMFQSDAKLIVLLVRDTDTPMPRAPLSEQTLEVTVTCIGLTKANKPCGGSPYDGTDYCVAHQDQVPPLE